MSILEIKSILHIVDMLETLLKYILNYYYHAHADYPQHKKVARAMMKKYGVPFVKDSKIKQKSTKIPKGEEKWDTELVDI